MANDLGRLIWLLEIFDLLLGELNVNGIWDYTVRDCLQWIEGTIHVPIASLRFCSFVVPTIGAVITSLERLQAIAT